MTAQSAGLALLVPRPLRGVPEHQESMDKFRMNRRSFLSAAGMAVAAHSLRGLAPISADATGKADHTLSIDPSTLEIGPGVSIKTLAFNGQVPGPLLRLREGVPVTIDVTNNGPEADLT